MFHFRFIAVAIDDRITLRRLCRTLQVRRTHTGKKSRILALEAVFVAAAFNARHRHFQWHIQQNGQIGAQAALNPVLQHLHLRRRQTAAAALIGKRRIREAVAHHMNALRQSRQHHIFQMLAARGKHQQRFRVQRHARLRVEQQFAQFFAQRRAARFARKHHEHLPCRKPVANHIQLRRFPRTVNAVQRDELSACFHKTVLFCADL